MRSKCISYLLIVSFFMCSVPSLQADGMTNETQAEETVDPGNMTSTAPVAEEMPSTSQEEEDENPIGSPVSAADTQTEQKKGNRQFWTNIIIAGVAVIVAVVSILVVSNNNGKKA